MKFSCVFFLAMFTLTAVLLYLSYEFLLFGRLRHAADLLVQLFEGRLSITLSLR